MTMVNARSTLHFLFTNLAFAFLVSNQSFKLFDSQSVPMFSSILSESGAVILLPQLTT